MDADELRDAIDELLAGMPPAALCDATLRLIRGDLARARRRADAEARALRLDRAELEGLWTERLAELQREHDELIRAELGALRLAGEREMRVA